MIDIIFENIHIPGEKYVLLSAIGDGGTGRVYLSYDRKLHKKWAVKEIKIGELNREAVLQSIQEELHVLKSLDHRNLPRIVDAWNSKEAVYFVLDYVDGINLDQYRKQKNGVTELQAIQIAIEITDTFQYLHFRKNPVIYRDLKPSNVMIKEDGTIKLIDFGASIRLGKVLESISIGTREYAAPEQWKGYADERSDIYTLGKTMLACQGTEKYHNDFIRILRKCIHSNPRLRFQNTQILYNALCKLQRRRLHKKNISIRILIPSFLILVLLITSFSFKKRQIKNEYQNMIELGDGYCLEGKCKEAAAAYQKAIKTLDGSRQEAYCRLLNLYYSQGKAQEGVELIEVLLEGNEVSQPEALYFQMGQIYFYNCLQYEKAEICFQNCTYQDAVYYQQICNDLILMDQNPEELKKTLLDFQIYNYSIAEIPRKIRNQQCIARVYLMNEAYLQDGLQKAEKVLMEEQKILSWYEGTERTEFQMENLGMLSTIYKLLGKKEQEKKQLYYQKSVNCLNELFSINGMKESDLYRMKLMDFVQIQEELGNQKEAIQLLEEWEGKYPEEGKELYIEHACILLKMEQKQVELKALFHKMERLPGIEQDARYEIIKKQMNGYQNVTEWRIE